MSCGRTRLPKSANRKTASLTFSCAKSCSRTKRCDRANELGSKESLSLCPSVAGSIFIQCVIGGLLCYHVLRPCRCSDCSGNQRHSLAIVWNDISSSKHHSGRAHRSQ